MLIQRVEAENFLSFAQLELDALDSNLNVVVGPNGAGKTNLIRLLRVACDGLNPQTRRAWEQSEKRGSRKSGFRVRIKFQLTEECERPLWVSFVRAVLSTLENVPDELGPASLSIPVWLR